MSLAKETVSWNAATYVNVDINVDAQYCTVRSIEGSHCAKAKLKTPIKAKRAM